MALGRRREERQQAFWVSADAVGSGPRNVFYDRLNRLLAEIEFDRQLEAAAEPYYDTTGRKSLPPGVYFRMIFIGYFEDISSQRGIAWRCEDSRSLARFLAFGPGEATPDYSTLSLTRDRLPVELHHLAFELVLAAAQQYGLLKGKTIGVDATDLEANAAMTGASIFASCTKQKRARAIRMTTSCEGLINAERTRRFRMKSGSAKPIRTPRSAR
ncbi:transposase [Blastopirellula sp. J2-11]|uniref:transposase n=1 Tax=Blastopirellula sp. J2-11 TaxID=2943192 RepID=UPI0021C8EB4A|nr:transposase [Blastopirellula sp. J2-11]UUO04526.1 transposase [Blastopirellula sp. J2-11]